MPLATRGLVLSFVLACRSDRVHHISELFLLLRHYDSSPVTE